MKLIPNNIDITDQFKIRTRFVQMVQRWMMQSDRYYTHSNLVFVNTQLLLKESGVRCYYISNNLAGFVLEDEELYTVFALQYL